MNKQYQAVIYNGIQIVMTCTPRETHAAAKQDLEDYTGTMSHGQVVHIYVK
jgi:hypothetical protein